MPLENEKMWLLALNFNASLHPLFHAKSGLFRGFLAQNNPLF